MQTILLLVGCPIIIIFVGDTTLEEQQHMFMLEEQGESHCFAAANQTELDEWLSSLRAAINELRQNTLESSGSKITEENGIPLLFCSGKPLVIIALDVLLSAWLSRQKTKMGIEIWRKRWCVLKSGRMLIYKAKDVRCQVPPPSFLLF